MIHLAAWSLLALTAVEPSAVSSRQTKSPSGCTLVVIENDLYRLTFEPARGGRCSSFVVKASGREWVYDGPTAGLFQDHFAHQYYPGELLEAAYEHAIEQETRTVTIVLWTLARGGRDGQDKLTQGLRVEKRITLQAGRREIRVVNTFTNPTAEGKNVALWVQHCFCYGGQRLFDSYYRPSGAGISLDGMDDEGRRKIVQVVDDYGLDWVRDPVAGWTAGRDRRTNEGAVFLMDYNYLNILYNCANSYTTEWFMDKVPLPAGKSWSTEYWVVPVDGFTAFVHASRRLIANVEPVAGPAGLAIRHQLAGTADPLGRVTLVTSLYGVRSRKEEALPPVVMDNVGLAPAGASQVWPQAQTEPLVLRVMLEGQGWTERYEYLYEGRFGAQGIQGAGSLPEYTIPRPAKTKTFFKPDTWVRPASDRFRVLVLFGLWTQHYRLEEALKAVDPACQVKLVDGWDHFPPTYDELLRYDLLVLSNAPAGPDYANEMVADFVRHGGALLALGGLLTYGGGQWGGTPLEPLLPVTIPGRFDLKWMREGAAAVPVGAHPVTAGLRWPAEARFFWIHEATPRPDAVTVLTAEGRPALVLGAFGEGHVAAVLLTCLGEPPAGQTAGWETEAWVTLLTRTLRWLKERR